MDKLTLIREYLRDTSSWGDFPVGHCDVSSKLVKQTLGFRMVRGVFLKKELCEDNRMRLKRNLHYWNLLPDGRILDLTAGQFDKALPDIYIVSLDSPEARAYKKEKEVGHFIE